MSRTPERPGVGDDPRVPRLEPWLGVMLGAFVPLLVAAVLPLAWRGPLFAASIALLIVGVIMAIVPSRRR